MRVDDVADRADLVQALPGGIVDTTVLDGYTTMPVVLAAGGAAPALTARRAL